jgi:hypothetical protein
MSSRTCGRFILVRRPTTRLMLRHSAASRGFPANWTDGAMVPSIDLYGIHTSNQPQISDRIIDRLLARLLFSTSFPLPEGQSGAMRKPHPIPFLSRSEYHSATGLRSHVLAGEFRYPRTESDRACSAEKPHAFGYPLRAAGPGLRRSDQGGYLPGPQPDEQLDTYIRVRLALTGVDLGRLRIHLLTGTVHRSPHRGGAPSS